MGELGYGFNCQFWKWKMLGEVKKMEDAPFVMKNTIR